MKAKFCLILVFLICFGTTYSFAVDLIKENDRERCGLFNAAPTKESSYLKHTTEINQILSNEKKVDHKRRASLVDKEIILKAVMGTVIIHGLTKRLTIFEHDVKHVLYRHYEILRLTEELSYELVMQYKDKKKTDITCLDGYKNLYAYSGLEQKMLAAWFGEAMSAHQAGLNKRAIEEDQSNQRKPTLDLESSSGRTSIETIDEEDKLTIINPVAFTNALLIETSKKVLSPRPIRAENIDKASNELGTEKKSDVSAEILGDNVSISDIEELEISKVSAVSNLCTQLESRNVLGSIGAVTNVLLNVRTNTKEAAVALQKDILSGNAYAYLASSAKKARQNDSFILSYSAFFCDHALTIVKKTYDAKSYVSQIAHAGSLLLTDSEIVPLLNDPDAVKRLKNECKPYKDGL